MKNYVKPLCQFLVSLLPHPVTEISSAAFYTFIDLLAGLSTDRDNSCMSLLVYARIGSFYSQMLLKGRHYRNIIENNHISWGLDNTDYNELGWLIKMEVVIGMDLTMQRLYAAQDLLDDHVAAVHPRTMHVTVWMHWAQRGWNKGTVGREAWQEACCQH